MTPRKQRGIAAVVGSVGVLIALGAALADVLRLGQTPEYFGRYQFLGITFGLALIVIAALFILLAMSGNGEPE